MARRLHDKIHASWQHPKSPPENQLPCVQRFAVRTLALGIRPNPQAIHLMKHAKSLAALLTGQTSANNTRT